MNEFEESIKGFSKLSLKDESSQTFLNNKAKSFYEFDRLKEAFECFDRCMAIKEGTTEYIDALANKLKFFNWLTSSSQ